MATTKKSQTKIKTPRGWTFIGRISDGKAFSYVWKTNIGKTVYNLSGDAVNHAVRFMTPFKKETETVAMKANVYSVRGTVEYKSAALKGRLVRSEVFCPYVHAKSSVDVEAWFMEQHPGVTDIRVSLTQNGVDCHPDVIVSRLPTRLTP